MPDFNKGDFTQQGVNGHVNATVRLNEKRLVNIDLTSNEEAEGCTIAGTVKDLLNDKVYGIGSGVSGNIEITENGENINVAPYATATVNVSTMDTAEVTISNLAPSTLNLFLITITEYGMELFNDFIVSNNENSYVLPLYQGAITLDCATCFPGVSLAYIHVTGDITLDSDDEIITITGDGTIDIGVR